VQRPADLDNRLIRPEAYGGFGAPHEAWEWLRSNDPVHWTQASGTRPFWSITTHADLMEVSSQPDTFSNAAQGVVVLPSPDASVKATALSAARRVLPKDLRRRIGSLRPQADDVVRPIVLMDPPDHRVFRKVASGFFTPRGIAELADTVQRITVDVLDAMAERDDPVDFVEAASHRQPMLILAKILGLDEAQTAEVLALTTAHYEVVDPAGATGPDDPRSISSDEERRRWIVLIDEIVARRQRAPGDDLSTLLVNATVDGQPLGRAELRGYFLILFTAGHDTTRHSLSGALNAFLDFPEQLDRVLSDEAMVAPAVEEVVRWTTPVNYMKRTAMRDYNLSGVSISRGDELALFYGSACRDEKVFDRPNEFDVGRSPNRHLGFGWAEHYCLGAHLARSSLQTFLRELRIRITAAERAGEPTWTAANFVTGCATLPVQFSWR